MREKLRDSTVITIAHRLNTIKDCDKILVFKEGEVVESGTFDTLLSNEGSVFNGLSRIEDTDR